MDITQSRKKIDELDSRMLELFVERLQVVEALADYKEQQGIDVFDPAREADKLRSAAFAGGKKYSDCTRRFMGDMMAICREYQSLLREHKLKG